MTTLWHLALECSSTGGSVALLECQGGSAEPKLRSQIILPDDRGSVCTLAPTIAQILGDATLRARDLECLSVTAGPGSFTGLRVGLSTAKMLAMACQKPVVPVDTLAAIAQRFARQHVRQQACQPAYPLRLVTALNAFRKQVFTASWFINGTNIVNLRAACVVDVELWLANPWGAETPAAPAAMQPSVVQEPEEVWISGPGLSVYMPGSNVSAPWVRIAPAELWQPLAEDVGWLGWQGYQQGRAVSANRLAPNYLRASAAEEKRRASGSV